MLASRSFEARTRSVSTRAKICGSLSKAGSSSRSEIGSPCEAWNIRPS